MKSLYVVLLLVAATSTETIAGDSYNDSDDVCPTWYLPVNGSMEMCECGATYGGFIRCNEADQTASVLTCNCVTTDDSGQLSFSVCLYTCSIATGMDYTLLPANSSQVNDATCGPFNRKGLVCGECEEGYQVTGFSLNLMCVECTDTHWLLYFAMTLLPLTAFFLVVIIFRFHATSAWLDAYIFFSQIITSPGNSRAYLYKLSDMSSFGGHLVQTVYGIWNLNFLELLVPPFCIHPGFSTLYVMALEYMTAFYPLFLVLITYIVIELYAHNFKPLVVLWKPFRTIFIRFHRKISIKNSTIDAFATFILLAYVKIAYVSYDLLDYAVPKYPTGDSGGTVWLFNASVPYFQGEHLGFGILAIFMLFLFTILPLLFLLLYPCKFFQRAVMSHLNRPQIREFVDCFQGHYKDGTSGTRDYRYFSVVYLLLRVVGLGVTEFLFYGFIVPIGGILIVGFAMSVLVLQPYRKSVHNICNGVILLVMGMWLMAVTLYHFPLANVRGYFSVALAFEFTACLLPLVYFVFLIMRYAWKGLKINKCAESVIASCKQSMSDKTGEEGGVGEQRQYSFADRIIHPERYNNRMKSKFPLSTLISGTSAAANELEASVASIVNSVEVSREDVLTEESSTTTNESQNTSVHVDTEQAQSGSMS